MRKLASIVRIARVTRLPDGRHAVVSLEGRGWQIVRDCADLPTEARAVYCEIDSVLPLSDGRFARLAAAAPAGWTIRDGGLRVRSARIGGRLSQGALLPLSEFPELEGLADGADVTAPLGVTLARDDADALPAEGRGVFPGFVPRTDEERIQNRLDYFASHRGRLFEVTEKLDGTSMTVFHSRLFQTGSPLRVCSRKLDLRATEESPYWQVARRYDLRTKLRTWARELAFQGELVGPGVNGNRGGFPRLEWHVFRIWDIARSRYLEPAERRALCRRLEIPHVPVVEESCPVFDRFAALDDLLAWADGPGVTGRPREGLVFKEIGTACPASFKAVSNRYLLGVDGPSGR